MFPDFVNEALKGMGPTGAAISVLLTFIVGLATAIGAMYRQSNKVYGYRLAERDTLNKALTDSTIAINAMTKATDERNEVTDDLADAIEKQTSAFDRLSERYQMQHDVLKDEVKSHAMVVGSLAEAIRTNTGMVTDIRNYISQQPRRPR